MGSCERTSDYVSFDTALSLRCVLDDVTYVNRIACVRGDYREQTREGYLVEWISLPDDVLALGEPTGDLTHMGLPVADPEKALCDLLWLCESRGFTVPVDSLRLDGLDSERLSRYAAHMLLDLRRLGGGSGR
ncbi:MAG: hypothetical protein AMXMBFR64_27270 [Myxococcales bacterium]